MKKCIMHIGHAKTATTYLQSAMHLNEDLFAANGYWVPSEFRQFGSFNFRDLALASKSFEGNLSPLFYAYESMDKTKIESIFAYIFNGGHNSVLLSSELLFYYVDLIALVIARAMAQGYAVKIVGYLQRQDRAVVSAYLQNVRNHGFSGTVLEFLRQGIGVHYFRYFDVLDRIARSTSGVDMAFRTFEPSFLRANDILSDFLDTFDDRLQCAQFRRPSGRVNSGLKLEQYEIIRALNILGETHSIAEITNLESELTNDERERCHGYYYRADVRKFVIDNYVVDNKRLVADFIDSAAEDVSDYWQTVRDVGPEVQLASANIAECLSTIGKEVTTVV
jgi:hypothetical protein